MAKALLLLNPHSRDGDRGIHAGLARLERAGIQLLRETPEGAGGMAAAIARHQGNIDRVIVGGGDGTVNAVLDGVLASGLPLGLLPLGTANDFARSLGLPDEIEAACAVIAAGHSRRVDVGEVNGRYFINVAHVGLAAEVAKRSDGRTKERFGVLAYPYAAWNAFRTRRGFTAHILVDNSDWRRLRVLQISVGNGRFYGGGIPVAEGAVIDDGRLDLYAIPVTRLTRLLAMASALRSGRTRAHDDIVSMRGQRVEIRTSRPKTLAVDGELGLKTPATFCVHPAVLPVFVPE